MPPKKAKSARSVNRSPPAKRRRCEDDLGSGEQPEPYDDDVDDTIFLEMTYQQQYLPDNAIDHETLVLDAVAKRYVDVEILVDKVTDLVETVTFQRENELRQFPVYLKMGEFKPNDLYNLEGRSEKVFQKKLLILNQVIHEISENMAYNKYNNDCYLQNPKDATSSTKDKHKDKSGSSQDKPGPSRDKHDSAQDRPGPSGDKTKLSGNKPGPSGDKTKLSGDKPGSSQPCEKSWIQSVMTECRSILANMLHDNFRGKIVKGFCNRMRNCVGRDTLCLMLRYACRFALGCSYFDAVVYQVGTANFPKEGFPVKLKPREIDLRSNDQHDKGMSSPPSTVSSASEATGAGYIMKKYLQGSSASHGSGKGYIYADALLVDGSDLSCPKILVVGEVKSDDSLKVGEHVGQVMRQMLGAIVNQNQVFGLLLCSTEAQLLKMEFCGDEIVVKNKKYQFCSAENKFRSEQLMELFQDLIFVVAYGHDNMRHKDIWCQEDRASK